MQTTFIIIICLKIPLKNAAAAAVAAAAARTIIINMCAFETTIILQVLYIIYIYFFSFQLLQ